MHLRLILAACLAVVSWGTARAADIELPPGPSRDLVYAHCRTCHDLQYLEESAGITGDDWDVMLDSMRQYGLRLAPDIRKRILGYLATYLGPNPPAAAPQEEETATVDGETAYREQCVACHHEDGRGVKGQFPPLAGNPALFADRLFPVYVLLYGLDGPINAGGAKFDGAMPPFDHLSNGTIAALVNYVRSAWDNAGLRPVGMAPVDAAAVERARAEPMTASQVWEFLTKR